MLPTLFSWNGKFAFADDVFSTVCSHSPQKSPDVLPRIWWCPTGPLTFLPLHAAGIYGVEDEETILDYAVSSYTPTISSLTERVQDIHEIDTSVSGLLLVSQPEAPGFNKIKGTETEVQSIKNKANESSVRVLVLEGTATVDGVLDGMEEYSSIHLACHAIQSHVAPLRSRFFLSNGLCLDLGTIIGKNLKHADLAFLSACQTGAGEETLSEEVVHLAGGMLAAGYRRVVATMWSIDDRHARDIAQSFYESLFARSVSAKGGIEGSQAAYALHDAIQRKRGQLDNSEKSLLTWIPYVHYGL